MKLKKIKETMLAALLVISLVCGQGAVQMKAISKEKAEETTAGDMLEPLGRNEKIPRIDGTTLEEHEKLGKSRTAVPYSSGNSITQVFDNIFLEEEGNYVYVPFTLAPGDIMQATLESPKNADIDYDLVLYEFDNAELGAEIVQRGLTPYLNDYDGEKKTVDEGLAYINETVNDKEYALFIFASKGCSTTEAARLTVSIDENGYYDSFEPNDSPFDARSITENVQVTGNTLNVSNDQDWFVWKVPSSLNKVSLQMDNPNYSVEMYVASGRSMVLQNPDSNGNYLLSHTYYYIKVFNKSSSFVSGSYNLKIQSGTQPPAPTVTPMQTSTPVPTQTPTPVVTQTPAPTEEPEQVVKNIKIKSLSSDTSPNKVNYGEGSFYRFKYKFTVTFKVTDASGNPVPDKPLFCIWQSGSWVEGSGNDTRDGWGVTDANGEVQITIDGPPAVGSHKYETDGPVIIRHLYDIDALVYKCGDVIDGVNMYHLAYSMYVDS